MVQKSIRSEKSYVRKCTKIVSTITTPQHIEKIDKKFPFFAGSRSQRSITALANLGPAVLNGGISTFLALVLLAASESYVFSTFFKVPFF